MSYLDAMSLEVELFDDDEEEEEDEDIMILTSKLRPLVRKDTSICMVAPPDFRLTPYKRRKTGLTCWTYHMLNINKTTIISRSN